MNTSAGQMETKILAVIRERGHMSLEELPSCLPESTWNQVFLSVDDLSRKGTICLRRQGFGYELWAPAPSAPGLFKRTTIPPAA
jgi:hypothetical protein